MSERHGPLRSPMSPMPVARLLALLALAACAANAPAEPTEHTATSRQAVSNGTTDDANDFPHTAALFGVDQPGEPVGNEFCSSFLATRRYLVSASHCFESRPPEVAIDAVFATFAATVSLGDPRLVTHRYNGSNPILRHLTVPLDEDNEQDRAKDVAVIRLDTRVPPSVANPIRPAGLTTPRCGHTFDSGTIVGFGPRVLASCGFIFCGPASGLVNIRNFTTSDGWERDINSDGSASLFNEFFRLSYDGLVKGDSGGPLFDGANDRVCGVASNVHVGPVHISSYFAALDTDTNIGWLADILMNKERTFFIGERPGPDKDNDGVTDVDDNCPNIANPDQESSPC